MGSGEERSKDEGGRRLDPGMRAVGFRGEVWEEVEIVAGYVFLRSGIDRRESERWGESFNGVSAFMNSDVFDQSSTQSAAPRVSRFKCSAGQARFFTRLGRLIKEKAKSDVDKLFSGFTKTRDNLAVIDELLLYWNLADTDRVLEDLEEALLVSDFGPRITFKIVDSLREDILSGKLKSGSEIKEALKKCV